jgi:hypothetical protein
VSRFSSLLNRLNRLEPEPKQLEPWPPVQEGSLSKILYDQLREEGVELPAERPEHGGFMFLIMKSAERCWPEAADGAT